MISPAAHSCVPESLLLNSTAVSSARTNFSFLVKSCQLQCQKATAQPDVKLRNSVETGDPVCEY